MGITSSCLVDKTGDGDSWKKKLLSNKCQSLFAVSVLFFIIILILFIVEIVGFAGSDGFTTIKEGLENPSPCKISDNLEGKIRTEMQTIFEGRSRDIKSMTESQKKLRLCDVHIASSYNTCRAGGINSTKVAYYPIQNALLHGARFLDFEIYSIGGIASVGASDKSKINFKTTTNCLPLSKVLKEVDNMAFTITSDPLFLNFRIKTNDPNIGSLLVSDINTYLDKNRLLRCGATCNGDALPSIKLGSFEGKYIIICNKPENNDANTSTLNMYLLDNERINISDIKTDKMWNIRRNGIINEEKGKTQERNRDKLCIIYPNLVEGNNAIKNIDGVSYMSDIDGTGYAANFVAMNYQTYDENLKKYINYFEGHSFIVKHDELMYQPLFIQVELSDDAPLAKCHTKELIEGNPSTKIEINCK